MPCGARPDPPLGTLKVKTLNLLSGFKYGPFTGGSFITNIQ